MLMMMIMVLNQNLMDSSLDHHANRFHNAVVKQSNQNVSEKLDIIDNSSTNVL